MRVRVVEEYRGRRIMSDGRCYGVERLDGVDLRYVTSRDARKEIDSEQGAAEYKRTRDDGPLWIVVPDESPLACGSCGQIGVVSGRRRRNVPDCEPEPDTIVVFKRLGGRFVRVGVVRSIASRQYIACEEPPHDEDHRRHLDHVVAVLREQHPTASR